MYPTFFRIGTFEVTSFGVMVAIGALVGLWVFGRELSRSKLPASGGDAAMAGVFGGLVGAKLLWIVEHLGESPLRDLLLSRGYAVRGPFVPLLRSPEVMLRAKAMGDYLRFKSTLGPRLNEKRVDWQVIT